MTRNKKTPAKPVKRRRPGPRKKDNAAFRRAFLALVRKGNSRASAARRLGVSPETIRNIWRVDEEFRKQIEKAEADSIGRLEEIVHKAAKDNPRWAFKILAIRSPKRWAVKKQLQISGPKGGPVEINHLSDEQLVGIIVAAEDASGSSEGTAAPPGRRGVTSWTSFVTRNRITSSIRSTPRSAVTWSGGPIVKFAAL